MRFITNKESRVLISVNLLDALIESKMSQADLARALQRKGTSLCSWRSRVCRWCQGKTLPSPRDLVNIAKVLHIHPGILLQKHLK